MNLGKENEIVEFKESLAEFEKACKAIVAMLNKTGHGTIYFGVKDNGDVIGVNVGKDSLSNLTDRIKSSILPEIYPKIEVQKYDKFDVISVSFNGSNKPYAFKGAFYIRVEQQNLIMNPLVVRELIQESKEFNEKWENEITEFGIENIDIKSLEQFYKQSVSMGRINKYDHTPEELLTQLNLMVDGKITKAGIYLFGNNSPLVYKAVEYATTERLNPIDLKRFEGNVFSLINDTINFINSKINWKVEINGIQRTEIPEIPVVAIREIIINSLVHADYFGDTEHQITIDPNTIEIYNPGKFNEHSPMDYINETLPSKTRHKTIQSIIFKAFDVETLGRGLKRTNEVCKNAKIKWGYKMYPYGFSFLFNRNNRKQEKVNLSLNAIAIFDAMKENNNILRSKEDAAKIIKRNLRTVSSVIAELINAGLIERIGSNKTGYWKVIDK